MLLTRPKSRAVLPNDQASVHNFYERMVTETLLDTDERTRDDIDYLADTTCVALNHLPPRYIRHDVDMKFFLSPIEYDEMQKKVQDAVNYAIKFVSERESEREQSQVVENTDSPDADSEADTTH